MIKKIRPLCVSFPKINTNRSFDKNNCMCFMIEDKKFLINEIWEKVSNIIKKNLMVNLYTIKHIQKRKTTFLYTSNID